MAAAVISPHNGDFGPNDEPGTPMPDGVQSTVPHKPGALQQLYDVQRPVGKGGYAIVHKGIRLEDGKVVAIKRVEVRPAAGERSEWVVNVTMGNTAVITMPRTLKFAICGCTSSDVPK